MAARRQKDARDWCDVEEDGGVGSGRNPSPLRREPERQSLSEVALLGLWSPSERLQLPRESMAGKLQLTVSSIKCGSGCPPRPLPRGVSHACVLGATGWSRGR